MRIPVEKIYLDEEPRPDWLIPNMIHEGNMIVVAGLAGVGKSFFSYALSNALATGSAFIDRALPPKRILYFDDENSRADLSAYARWTWRGLGSPSRDLLSENLRIESRTLSGAQLWGRALQDISAEFKPDLLIIDTATPACHIVNENDNGEASAAAQKIRIACDVSGPQCSALILKHLKVDPATGHSDIRGAKAWNGAVDAVWHHKFRAGQPRKNGWRTTYIQPEKSRAFGLRDNLIIRPIVTSERIVKLEIIRKDLQIIDSKEDTPES